MKRVVRIGKQSQPRICWYIPKQSPLIARSFSLQVLSAWNQSLKNLVSNFEIRRDDGKPNKFKKYDPIGQKRNLPFNLYRLQSIFSFADNSQGRRKCDKYFLFHF